MEGWEVVPEHWAAAHLPQLHPPHRDQQFTCNTDWIAAIIPHCPEHEIAGTGQEFMLMISGFSLLWPLHARATLICTSLAPSRLEIYLVLMFT